MPKLGKRKEREEEESHLGDHGATLFVSNIPYAVTSTDLQTLFSDIAPVRYAFVVLDHASGVSKGVGYVSFAIKDDAQAAFDKISSEGLSLVGRALRVGWAGRKPKHKDEGAKEHPNSPPHVRTRPGKEKMTLLDQVGGDGVDLKDALSGEDSDYDSDESTESWALGSPQVVHASSSKTTGEDEDDTDDRPAKPQLPPPESGTTLFIRNVPFSATDDELRTLFRTFGPLRYARITLDHATGRSRGTGFACFWNKEDADKVIRQSELLRSDATGGDTPKKNPFTTPSILTPDPSSTLAQSLVLHGRTLDAVRAVTRDEAGKLKEEGDKRREKADKRNLYLLREGVIMPNTPAAETLTPIEVEKRTSSYNARRALLRSNPSLYISKTRLSIRQIPMFVTERLLKRLALYAVRNFESEVKKGLRVAIAEGELVEDVNEDPADGDEGGKKERKTVKRTGVKQAKIVRQAERVDPVTGKGRSKGYGFLEMRRHADALRVLRWSNNNPKVASLFEQWWKEELESLVKQEETKETKDEARLRKMKEAAASWKTKKGKGMLIVEFSIENVQVVHRRNAHQREDTTILKRRDRPQKLTVQDTKQDRPPSKKRRVSVEKFEEIHSIKEEPVKPGRLIGPLIGRKRKERHKAG